MIKLLPRKVLLCLLVMSGLFLMNCKKDVGTAAVTPSVSGSTPTGLSAPLAVDPYSALASDTSLKAIFLYKQDTSKKYTTHKFQGCPSIGISGNNYFAAWFSGGDGEQPGNYVTVALSTDKGVTWKEHQLIITSNDATMRYIDPLFWSDKYGKMNLSFVVSKGMWDGAKLGSSFISLKVVNGNILITKPQFLFHGATTVKPTPLKSDSSVLVFPVAGWNPDNPWFIYPITPTPSNLQGAYFYTSTYDPSTHVLLEPQKLSKITDPGPKLVFAEHMIVDLGNNNYKAIIRIEGGGIYYSTSDDGGLTWAKGKPFTELGENCTTKSFFGKLKSGNLLFVLNNATTRTKLTAYLSTDNGKTWGYKLLIDNRTGVSYPDVAQDDNGRIAVVYDRDRSGATAAQEINLATFTEADIKSGDASKINKLIISHK